MTTVRRVIEVAKSGHLWSALGWRLRESGTALRDRLIRWKLGLAAPRAGTLPAMTLSGRFEARPEARQLKASFAAAREGRGRLPAEIRAIQGMSGQSYRTFINDFVGASPDARYLEVGSWAGSTATAALFGNRVRAVCIDNWSLFGGPKEAFQENMRRVVDDRIDFRFIESDFRTVDFASVGRFNVYLFDGPHEEIDQYDGVVLAQPALEPTYLLIVDDWNWRAVRNGTFRALLDTRCRVEAAIEVRTTLDNTHATVAWEKSDWHNGYFLAIVTKAGA